MSHHNWQPNKPSPNGIWHKTTLQQAKEQQEHQRQQNHHQSFQQRSALTTTTNVVIGQKRTINEVIRPQFQNEPPLAKRPTPGPSSIPTPGFKPSAFIKPPSGPPPLTASTIEYADPAKARIPSEYSQRRALPSTPISTNDPLLSLSHPVYKLPKQVVANFASLGIKYIYPWQKQCLLGPGLLSGAKHLVYSAPTGGGKSLVADLLMLKSVLDDPTGEAKAILVLPYVALVQEKVRWLRSVVGGISRSGDLGQKQSGSDQKLWAKRADKDTIRVVGFFGGSKVRATWADFDVAVCTMEKANSLINAAITDCSISKLRAVVLDECHMIDDGYRGYLLELMTTKLLCLEQQVQIIAMSATLTNIRLLKDWLGGHSYETHYRPVPIEEHLVYDGKIYPAATTASLLKTATQLDTRNATTTTQGLPPSTTSSLQHVRFINPSSHREFKDPVMNAVVALANETARAGYGVLVFSSSRAGCESDAVLISRVLPSFSQVTDSLIRERRLALLNDLRNSSTGLDPKLEQTIPCGLAFHHAGLTTEERELIANAYDAGTLKVCVATASLAAGINLPARRVILHGARMGIDLVGPAMLRQMRGRAGRKGKDEVGETYLCCRRNDLEAVVDLMHADLPQIASCLVSDERRIRRALLEVIAIKLATSREALDEYVSRTMLACEQRLKEWEAPPPEQGWEEKMRGHVEAGLEKLKDMGFITVTVDERYETASYSATKLGGAIVASSLDPDDGMFIHKELDRALKGFVMDGDMHVLYNFTPVSDLGNGTPINWKVFWNEMEKLDENGLRVMTFLGLKPVVLNRMLQGGILEETSDEEKDTARRYHRFYLALQLRDLCNEVPIHRVAQKYDVPRGAVQTLAQTCQGFAAGMIKFCEAMGWGAMAAALDHFADRLKAGARADLLGLSKLPFVKSRTARVFWDNGFKTVAVVANADPKELVPVLMQAQPNKVRLEAKDEQKYMDKLLAKAEVITDSANRIWQIEMQQELMAEEE